MASHFKTSYASVMETQLNHNIASTQLKLALPDAAIIALLKEVHVIPDDTDNKLSVVPDLFDSWEQVASKVADAWKLRCEALVNTKRTKEWEDEMQTWGRVTSTIDAWTMHRNHYSDMIRDINELIAQIDERRSRLQDFMTYGGASRRRKSSRLRQRRQ